MRAVGVDIGSTATKVAVLDGGTMLDAFSLPTGFSGVDAANRVRTQLESRGIQVEESAIVATGYGRISVPYATKVVTEITCHGRGAAWLFDADGVVVDIGGQDVKVIRMSQGRVTNFVMNDKCAAGTGKFIEVMATRMGVSIPQLCDLARSGKGVSISSVCTVFAESEVITLIGQGEPRENIAYGVIESVVSRVAALARQLDAQPCFLTGGLCECPYLTERLAVALGHPVVTRSEARYAGAIGAALSA